MKIDILEIRGALENCKWRENEEDGVAGKWRFVSFCGLTFQHRLQPSYRYYCPGLEFLLYLYYIWIKLGISFQEEQTFSSATWISKEWGVLSDAVMQEVRQCPTCGLSCVGRTTQCLLLADGKGKVIHSSKIKTPDIWCSRSCSLFLLRWQSLASCTVWFDVQCLCTVSLNSCEAVSSLSGPNSHLNCTALGLRQLLYTARILSLL